MEPVSLRDFIEQVIGQRIEHVKEMLSQRMDLGDTALDLQAHEYMRRLDELNHAHQQAVEDKEQFLPRENFDAFQSEFKLYRQEIERWRAELSTKVAAGDARSLAFIAAVGLGLTAFDIALRLLVK